MIHQYKSNGYNIVMDVNSGSVHVVDDIVYDMIPLVEPLVTEGIKDADTIKAAVLNLANIPYPQEEITEAVDEVLELEKAGQLFAPDIYENYIFDFKKRQSRHCACTLPMTVTLPADIALRKRVSTTAEEH